MLKAFCQQHSNEFPELFLSPVSWNQITELLKVLDVAAEITKKLQAEHLLVSDFVYEWFSMTEKLHAINSSYSKKLLKCVEERKEKIFKSPVILAGWYLDSRMMPLMIDDETMYVAEDKSLYSAIGGAKRLIRAVTEKLDILSGRDQVEMADVETPTENEAGMEVSPNPFEQRLLELGNKRKSQLVSPPAKSNAQLTRLQELELEFTKYQVMPMKDHATSLIDWWISKSEELPILSIAALNIITAPTTEVVSERQFSDLNVIVTDSRSSLKGPLIDDMLLLRMNKKFGI